VKKSVKRARTDRLQNEATEGWQAAHELAGRLIQGWQPTPLHVWGVVLAPGERLNFDLQAGYARLYGGSGQYTHTTGMFWGSAGFMAAGYALTALSNSQARAAAARQAQVRWREHQHTRVLVTDRRLLCELGGRWLSFYYNCSHGFYPDLMQYGVVLDFRDTAPVALSGPSAPFLAVYIAYVLYEADGLRRHPALEPLRAAMPAPALPGPPPFADTIA
jgi:hypothetical protein